MPLTLPAYSLELNLVERSFAHLRAKLANQIFTDLTKLEEAVTQHLQGFCAEPAVLRQMTGYGWWLAGLETIHASSL